MIVDTEYFGSMVTAYHEIDHDKYERLQGMPYGEAKEEVLDGLPPGIVCGYGFYGFKLRQQDGKYYLGVTTGRSCD